jgi:orotate phosphoribosyltransferase
MTDAKSTLLPLLPSTSALSFGTYTLKSGRQSPYFFNSSLLFTASLHQAVCAAYASVLSSPPFTIPPASSFTSANEHNPDNQPVPNYDILFGPAYKGIILAGSILPQLLLQTGHGEQGVFGKAKDDNSKNQNSINSFSHISYAYNRKEAKSHGEGGNLVGAPVRGKRVVIVDDVITAGTAVRDAVSLIQAEGGIVVGVVVLLDRQERVSDVEPRSALGVVSEELGVPVRAVVQFSDLIDAIEAGSMPGAGEDDLRRMKEYRETYQSRE